MPSLFFFIQLNKGLYCQKCWKPWSLIADRNSRSSFRDIRTKGIFLLNSSELAWIQNRCNHVEYRHCICNTIKLTLIELIANDYEKRNATAKHVENYTQRVNRLPSFAAHRIHDVLKVSRLHFVRGICQYEKCAADNRQ